MKVVEPNSDRQASAHVYVEGRIAALEEYGQYVDPDDDNAICCYVPIDEGNKAKIRTWFSGTTVTVSHDALIDGTLRKTISYAAKTINQQKNKRFDIEKFLYKTDKGVLNTDMIAGQLLGVESIQSDAPETVGTIELRLCVTRQLDVFHDMGDVRTYDTDAKDHDKGAGQTANYKIFPPSLQMTFEENCRPLEAQDAQREQRRLNIRRPGTEPWAIFRFHYRTREEIKQRKLKLTFNPSGKFDANPHILVVEPLPPLLLGTKSQKIDLGTPMILTAPHPVGGAQTKSSTPPKRSMSSTDGVKPESKRTKMTTESHPVTPKTVSMERHLTEQQKKLEKLRKRRIDQATEQAKVDEQMAEYKELMAAELERLNRDIIEEEGAYAEEVEHYKASVEVLQMFKKADSEV